MEQAKQEMEEQEAAKLVGRQAKLHVVQNWVAAKQNCGQSAWRQIIRKIKEPLLP